MGVPHHHPPVNALPPAAGPDPQAHHHVRHDHSFEIVNYNADFIRIYSGKIPDAYFSRIVIYNMPGAVADLTFQPSNVQMPTSLGPEGKRTERDTFLTRLRAAKKVVNENHKQNVDRLREQKRKVYEKEGLVAADPTIDRAMFTAEELVLMDDHHCLRYGHNALLAWNDVRRIYKSSTITFEDLTGTTREFGKSLYDSISVAYELHLKQITGSSAGMTRLALANDDRWVRTQNMHFVLSTLKSFLDMYKVLCDGEDKVKLQLIKDLRDRLRLDKILDTPRSLRLLKLVYEPSVALLDPMLPGDYDDTLAGKVLWSEVANRFEEYHVPRDILNKIVAISLGTRDLLSVSFKQSPEGVKVIESMVHVLTLALQACNVSLDKNIPTGWGGEAAFSKNLKTLLTEDLIEPWLSLNKDVDQYASIIGLKVLSFLLTAEVLYDIFHYYPSPSKFLQAAEIYRQEVFLKVTDDSAGGGAPAPRTDSSLKARMKELEADNAKLRQELAALTKQLSSESK